MAESIGFVGCLIVLGVLFAIAIRTLTIGANSGQRMGTYLCVGVFAAIAFQLIINLGMNLMLLPVIGVTLPFFSAGGSSVLMLYICVGLVLSVYRNSRYSCAAGADFLNNNGKSLPVSGGTAADCPSGREAFALSKKEEEKKTFIQPESGGTLRRRMRRPWAVPADPAQALLRWCGTVPVCGCACRIPGRWVGRCAG